MDEHELIRIIDGPGKKTARRRWNCPSDSQIAGYLEHSLERKEKLRFQAHLADCDFCISAVSTLVRQQRASEPAQVPIHLYRDAIDIVPVNAGWRMPWKWLLVPALAALVIIAIIWRRSPQPERLVASAPLPAVAAERLPQAIPQVPLGTPEKQYVRKLATRRSALQLLEPAPDSVWEKQQVRFSWRPVANATYYEIRVVNSEGDVMWRGQESETTVQFPGNLSLQSGKYFVWVRAYLDDGRTIKSNARAFWIRSSG